MSKEIFKDMGKYLPSQLAPAIVGLVIIPIVTRLFSPDIYGKYALVTTTIAVLATLSSWLPTSVYRFYFDYKKNNHLEEFYVTTFRLFFIATFLFTCFYLLILYILRTHLDSYLWRLLLIGILLFILGDAIRILTELLRLERKVGWFSFFNVISIIGSFGIGLFLIIFIKRDIKGLLWGGIFSSLLILPFVIKAVKNISFGNKPVFSQNLAFMMINYGFPVTIGNFSAWILAISDRYIIGLFKGAYEVGLYSISYGISVQTIGLLSSLFTLAVGPIGMKKWEYNGKLATQKFISKTARYSLLILLPACIGLSVLAKPVLKIFAPPSYIESYKIIPLVVFGSFIYNFGGRFSVGLLYHKKTNLIMLGTLLAGIANIILNFIFIPKYGYFAAAVTTLVSYMLLFVFTVVFSQKFFVWKFPHRTLLNTTIASSLMGFLVYLANNVINLFPVLNLVVLIFIGIFIYFSMLVLLKEFTNSELNIVKDFLFRRLPMIGVFYTKLQIIFNKITKQKQLNYE